MTQAATANLIGHNLPPTDAELFAERMHDKHEELLKKADDLIMALERMPTEINDDETAAKAMEYIKQINQAHKILEGIREVEKKPYLSMGRTVDSFFKSITDKLASVKLKANKPLTMHMQRMEEAERQRRIAEAAAKREEAERAAKAAEILALANKPAAAEHHAESAQALSREAEKVEDSANQKPCQLASVRTSEGVSSLRTRWWARLITAWN